MNKQELINELAKYVKRYENVMDDYSQGRYGAYKVSLKLAKRLDEPQKPVVPSCSEPWLKKAQYSSDVINLFTEVEYATNSDGFIKENWQWSPEFYDWLSEDADTLYLLCDALRYGYEVEKDPLWVVAVYDGEYYFTRFMSNHNPEDRFPWDSVMDKDKGHHFVDKDMAEAVAKITGGKVVEG